MRPLILIVCVCFVASFVQGQTDSLGLSEYHENYEVPFPGGMEACRHFFNENLNLKMVTDTSLAKGAVEVVCVIDTLGNPKYFLEDTGNKRIGREFLRVAHLIQWRDREHLIKDGLWGKEIIKFSILARIPYKPDDPNGLVFLYFGQ